VIDFSEIYDRFAGIKKSLIELENKLLSDGGRLSASEHSVILKTMKMAETEAQGVLIHILRIRGNGSTIRRHGQDAAVSWSAGIDPTSGQIALVTTDVFANVTETHIMPPDEFARLVDYFQSIKQQLRMSDAGLENPH
jgi:hypothetical protein